MGSNGTGKIEVVSRSDIVYGPQETADMTLEAIRYRREHKGEGLRSNLSTVDRYLEPLGPGDLISIIGLSGHLKSYFMMHMVRQALKQLKQKECVVMVTWEVSVEKLMLYQLANATSVAIDRMLKGEVSEAEYTKLERAALEHAATPYFLVGHSIQGRRKRPHMTIDDATEAMRHIEDAWGFKPALICLDYLQRIETEQAQDRRIAQMNAVNGAKDMALEMGCPVILGVQAKPEVLERQWKLPGMYDAQETSNVAQTSDIILSGWKPSKTEKVGSLLAGTDVRVTKNLWVLGILKQKMADADMKMFLHVDFVTGEFYPLEERMER